MSTPNMSGRSDAPERNTDDHLDPSDLLGDDGSIDLSAVKSVTNDAGNNSRITLGTCQAFRERMAADDAMPETLADEYDTTRSTVRRHARGDCHHTGGDIPGLNRGWYETDRDPDTVAGANGYVHAKQCGHIRRELLAGGTARTVADKLDVSRKVVERHGNGTCKHGHTNPAPLAFGWHIPEGDT